MPRYYVEVRSYDLGMKALLHEVGRWERIEQKLTDDLCSRLVCLMEVKSRELGEQMVDAMYKAEQEGRGCEWWWKMHKMLDMIYA